MSETEESNAVSTETEDESSTALTTSCVISQDSSAGSIDPGSLNPIVQCDIGEGTPPAPSSALDDASSDKEVKTEFLNGISQAANDDGVNDDEEVDVNKTGEPPSSKPIICYSREFLLRIGRAGSKSKIDIPIQDCIKVGNGKNPFDMSFAPMRGASHRGPPQGGRVSTPRGMSTMGRGITLGNRSYCDCRVGHPLPVPPPARPRIIETKSCTEQRQKGENNNSQKPSNNRSRSSSGGDWESTPDERGTERIVKQTREMLNELTPENYGKLCEKFLKLELNHQDHNQISAVVSVFFEEAANKSMIYSQVIAQLLNRAAGGDPQQQSSATAEEELFRKKIIEQYQKVIKQNKLDEAEISEKEKDISEDADEEEKETRRLKLKERRSCMRRWRLGNMRFIGELIKLKLIPPYVMVSCVRMLCGNNNAEESYNFACEFLTLVGPMLEEPSITNPEENHVLNPHTQALLSQNDKSNGATSLESNSKSNGGHSNLGSAVQAEKTTEHPPGSRRTPEGVLAVIDTSPLGSDLKEATPAPNSSFSSSRIAARIFDSVLKSKAEDALGDPDLRGKKSIDKLETGLKIGERVKWAREETGQTEAGVVKWLGTIEEILIAGVEFVNPLHLDSGWNSEIRLFPCLKHHGGLVSVAELERDQDYYDTRDRIYA